MSTIDRIAHTNRWRARATLEKATLALGLLALALAFAPWPTSLAVLAVAAGAAILGAGVPAATWGRVMLAPLGFVLTGAATLLIEIGPHGVALAPDGLSQAAALTLRATASAAALLLLAMTTPATDLVAGLARLRLPTEIIEIALLTYRFLFVLGDTAAAMLAAQQARLGHVGWRARIRSTGLIAANLLPRALDRARRLETGLAARGWSGGALAVLTPHRAVSPAGLAAVVVTLAALTALGALTR